jgi:hypothetical protein
MFKAGWRLEFVFYIPIPNCLHKTDLLVMGFPFLFAAERKPGFTFACFRIVLHSLAKHSSSRLAG